MDAVPTFGRAALTAFAPGVWLSSDPVRIVGMKLSSTMTVLELSDARLLVYSPVALTPERRTAVEALGTVAHLYAPNTFHHVWVDQWSRAFPSASVHGPSGLRTKRPELRIDRAHDVEPLGDPDAVLDEVPIAGFALQEGALIHRPSRTLLVADLVHNVGRPKDIWTSAYSKAMGFYDRVAISRMIRWTAFSDWRAARRSIDRLAGCAFDRMVVGHGAPIEVGAREALVAAYDWLGPRRKRLPAYGRRHGSCG